MKNRTSLALAINPDDVDAAALKKSIAAVGAALGAPDSSSPLDVLQAALAFLNSQEAGTQPTDDNGNPVDAPADPAAANALSRGPHRVRVGDQTYDVTLTKRQVESCARQGFNTLAYARSVARLFGGSAKAAENGVKLVHGGGR